MSNSQVIRFFGDGENRFVGVGDVGSTYIWMGVNDKAFAIGNALSEDLDRLLGNGGLMMYCLPICETLEDFEAILDSTNLTGRETNGNFAVIDSTGAAAMYEIGPTHYWKFDTVDSENGFVVRTNFAFSDNDRSYYDQYDRSNALLEELLADDNINYRTILQIHARDFSDTDSNPYDIPFEDYIEEGYPWGYVPSDFSICNYITGSAAVFRGVLSGEPPCLSTMWTMLGQPAGAIAFPVFPIGEPPIEANTVDSSALCARATEIKSQVFNCPGGYGYCDTYKLHNDAGTGIWDQVFPMEIQLFDEYDDCFDDWISVMPDDQTILDVQQRMTTDAYDFLQNVVVDTTLEPYFEADNLEPHPTERVHFSETTPHGPETWRWDFDNDGIFDSSEMNPTHIYTEVGTYTVVLRVSNDDGTVYSVREDYITVVNNPPEIVSQIPQEPEFEVVKDELITFLIEIEDDDGDPITVQWYWNSEEFTQLYSISVVFDQLGDQTIDCMISDGYSETWVNWLIHVVPLSEDDPTVPEYTWNLTNYPNPFNPSTTVSFSLKHDSDVHIDIYDVRGRKVFTLTDERYTAGQHQIVWDGISDDGREVASGVYLLRLTTGEANLLKKALLVK